MKFHSQQTYYEWFKKHIPHVAQTDAVSFYDRIISRPNRVIYEMASTEKGVMTNQMLSERDWFKSNCPYFNIHPALIDSFTKMRMDIPAKLIQEARHPSWVPIFNGGKIRSFVIRLPEEGNSLRIDDKHYVKTIMAHFVDKNYNQRLQEKFAWNDVWTLAPIPGGHDKQIAIWIDVNEKTIEDFKGTDFPVWTFHYLIWSGDDTVEQAQKKLPLGASLDRGVQVPRDMVEDCVRLVLSACFLANSQSSLIKPDLLAKDEIRLSQSKDKSILDKLHQRAFEHGKYGWNIGYDEMFTSSGKSQPTGKGLKWAHLRNMHWHVVRYGKNKEQARVDLYMQTIVREDLPFKPPGVS